MASCSVLFASVKAVTLIRRRPGFCIPPVPPSHLVHGVRRADGVRDWVRGWLIEMGKHLQALGFMSVHDKAWNKSTADEARA
eukprot:3581135-Rhodomonas_salina.1